MAARAVGAVESVSVRAPIVRERERAQHMILAQFWLFGGPSEAAQQHWGFLEALARPGRAALGHGAGGLSRAD